ncbi:Nodule Cysteine-Rich (NCR) secreted peptide [Medicago truncatula]|uniref:Nodule Cysteine-Rich (NCR) secreted peptide n=1 Tax=Medicago truncatula TaxID=3880 RepID=A0A072U1J7_MEDTR|nr:Nodule Cysteine-Rich (NCR) secreted peptide [Medicago truncatula]
MTQILKFIYTLIIFLSLFLVETNSAPKPCVTVKDCPKTVFPIGYKCIKNLCILVI